MKEITIDRIAARLRAKGHARHSDAYRWLLDRYAPMKQMLHEHKPSWPAVAEEVAAAGVRGVRGQVITGNDLRRIWQRVCRDRDMSASEERTGLPARTRRSKDVPPSWRPTVSEPSGPSTPQETPLVRESSFAAARRELEKRSGR